MTKTKVTSQLNDKNANHYPSWVCAECGRAAQPNKNRIFSISTFHTRACGVCGETKLVTEARDFGYPTFEIEIK